MRDLRMQVNQQMPASRSALTDSMASTSTDSPESGNSSRKAEAIARRKADTAPGAEAASVTPSGALDTIAPPALYSGMIPDLTLGRVVTRLRGDVVVEGGYVSQANDSHLNSSAVRERFRFIVNPEVQANGGFSYGGLVRYVVAKGDQSVNAPDRTFLYARGPYGDSALAFAMAMATRATFRSRLITCLPAASTLRSASWCPTAARQEERKA